jgi:hypothetical protein
MNAMLPTAAPAPFARTLERLVRFDLRRFRWLVLLVGALEIARAAFVEWAVHLVPPVIGERFGGAFGTQEVALLDGVLWLSTILVTAVLVQADLPADDRAFWRTRPIPPAGLALAKLAVFGLLFVAVPAAINAGRLLAYGAPLQAIGAATLQLAVGAGHVVMPAWALALVTRTLPRFSSAAVAIVIGSVLAGSAVLYWAEVFSGRGGNMIAIAVRSFVVDWQRLDAHGWWFAAGLTVVAAAILTAHYRHRSLGRSAAAVATLLILSWVLPARTGAPAPRALAGFGSALTIEQIELPTERRIQSRPWTPFPVSLQVVLGAPPLPRDLSAAVLLRHPRIEGREIVNAGDGSHCCFGDGAVGVLLPLLPPPTFRQVANVGLSVAVNDLPALEQPTVAIDTEAEVRFVAHRWIGTLPLRPGSVFRSSDQAIEILAFQPERRTILVRYTHFPSLDGSRGDWSMFAGPATRNRLSATNPGWSSRTPLQALTSYSRDRGTGRTWVGRFHVFVDDRDALDTDPRLYVVESSPVGVSRTRLARAGAPVIGSKQSAPR